MTTGKTIALTRRTFVGKVMSLLFNMLSRLVRVCVGRAFSAQRKQAVLEVPHLREPLNPGNIGVLVTLGAGGAESGVAVDGADSVRPRASSRKAGA